MVVVVLAVVGVVMHGGRGRGSSSSGSGSGSKA